MSGSTRPQQSLETLTSTCQTMLDLVDEMDSLDKRIHHLKTEIVMLSSEQTDMAPFLRNGRKFPSMLQGVSAAQKPFHGLPRMQQFDMMRKIMAMRTELSVKFESLRRAQMAIQRSKVIQDTIMRDGSGVPSSSGSYLPDNPEEGEFIKNLLLDNTDLANQIMAIEEKRIAKAVSNLEGKTRITELLSKCKAEFQICQEIEDDEEEVGEENEGDTSNVSPEVKALNKKRYQLNKAELRTIQMKTLVQKLMFSYPNASLPSRKDDPVASRNHEDMMFFCGKSLDAMREDAQK